MEGSTEPRTVGFDRLPDLVLSTFDALSARDLLVLLRAIWNEEALLANAREMHRALVAEAAL